MVGVSEHFLHTINSHVIIFWLVVLTMLKNMKVNGNDIIPYMNMKKKCLKPPASFD